MEAVYDKNNRLVSWMNSDTRNVFDTNMTWVGFVSSENFFSTNGHWLGAFKNNSFVDKKGKVVAYIRGASPKSILPPIRPLKPLTPIRPLKPLKPLKPLTPLRPLPPLGGWSMLSWDTYLKQ